MVALNSDFAASKLDTDTKNRVGRFFSLAAETVEEDSCSSREYTGKKRVYSYDTTSVDTEFDYGPFGELIRATGEKKDAFNFRFSTKYEDTETGLLYYGYRYYNAETGRWLSRDPIEEDGGLNLYGMVGNDPVNRRDLLGLATIQAPSNANISTTISDFFTGGPSNTWIFDYPHTVAKRFQFHKGVKFVWDLYYYDLEKYCEVEPTGSKVWKGKFSYTARLPDFKHDAATFLGYYGEGAIHGDYGTNSFGSFRVTYEVSIDCCNKEKSIKMSIFNRWSITSLFRNPFNRKPTITKDLLNPVDVFVNYDLENKF